jgi:hypothetical protein
MYVAPVRMYVPDASPVSPAPNTPSPSMSRLPLAFGSENAPTKFPSSSQKASKFTLVDDGGGGGGGGGVDVVVVDEVVEDVVDDVVEDDVVEDDVVEDDVVEDDVVEDDVVEDDVVGGVSKTQKVICEIACSP